MNEPFRDPKGEPVQLDLPEVPARKKRRFPWSLLICAALVALVGAGWLIRPQQQAGPGMRRAFNGPVPVATATVEKGSLPVTLTALGTVTPLTTVTVRSQISGRLTKISFQEGQDVKAGDPLAEVDPRPYEAALKQAQGQLARDQAQLRNAQLDLTRYQTLVAKSAASQQSVDTQEALVAQYQGTVQMDQAQVRTAELNLEYCHIVAPVSGRLGIRQVDVGNYVQAGDSTGIVVITQLKPITVVFSLPEDVVPQVARRLEAKADLPVTVYDRNRRSKIATGQLITIDNQVDTTTGTVKLKAQFPNDDGGLFPNQFVNVDLLVNTMDGAVILPSAAVQRGAPGPYVYVVGADQTVSVHKVKLGPSAGDKIAVLEGLNPGDKVVVDGADKLREGAQVTEPDAGQTPGQPGRRPGGPNAAAGQGPSGAPGAPGNGQPRRSQAPTP